jgi:hypothetical protein
MVLVLEQFTNALTKGRRISLGIDQISLAGMFGSVQLETCIGAQGAASLLWQDLCLAQTLTTKDRKWGLRPWCCVCLPSPRACGRSRWRRRPIGSSRICSRRHLRRRGSRQAGLGECVLPNPLTAKGRNWGLETPDVAWRTDVLLFASLNSWTAMAGLGAEDRSGESAGVAQRVPPRTAS